MVSSDFFCELGLAVIENEAQAIAALTKRINKSFTHACELLLSCTGRIIVMGIGKSGHIANKMAATFASTGSPAFFVHPAEASHGDMGMITRQDVVLAISYSGETAELLCLLPALKRWHIPLIAMTGRTDSTLAQFSSCFLDVSVEQEACPLGLAPTTSTIAALAMGDALAIALLQTKGFTRHDFAIVHPGGTLGRRLSLRACDLMASGEQLPCVDKQTLLAYALLEITEKKLGITTIVDEKNRLIGVYTDGDLRRTLNKGLDIHTTLMKDIINDTARTISPFLLAIDALRLMEDHKITNLVVIDSENHPVGILHIHHLLQAGIA